jgi:hypothetical protein
MRSTQNRKGFCHESRGWWLFGILSIVLGTICLATAAASAPAVPELTGRVVAAGIPGVGAVTVVGTFHAGGPIHDKPVFRAFTEAGAILDPERLLVTSTSNFGAPVARGDLSQGSVLSIDPRGSEPAKIPPAFVASEGQAAVLSGRVMLFSANSPVFLNRLNNPGAVTADLPPMAGPTGISINNAFGRIWVTSSAGPKGVGMQSVLDPDGRPLAGAPSKVAGGVFSGAVTNRTPQLIEGAISTGSLGTAFMGKSPDGSGRAVFIGLQSDGSIVQIQVEAGVDGLAPAGTIKPLTAGAPAARAGVAFNWVPNPILYITDPVDNSVVVLTLRSDGKLFHVESTRRIKAQEFNTPVDIAPAVVEVANPTFSSNTTLAGDADLYVANRGNGTITRIKQNGTVVAVRKIKLPGVKGTLGAGKLNGIAVSPDALHIYVTVSGKLGNLPEGAVVELAAFGGPGDKPKP